LIVLKASLVTAIAHGVRMLANLVVLKLIAISVGSTGFGLLGNFMSLITMGAVFSGGGISNGIAKYVAQYHQKPIHRIRFIGSAITYGATVSLFILIIAIVAAKPIATELLGNPGQAWLIPCFGIAQFLCFIGTGTIAVANGQQRIDVFAKISISAYVIMIPIAYLLVMKFGIDGAAIALLLAIACTAFPSIYLIAASPSRRVLRFRMTKRDLLNLGRFSVMVLVSAVCFPIAEIFVRNQIIAQLGYEQAGIWQALSKLSGAYLGFFLVFLSTHYMPTLAAITQKHQLIATVRNYVFGVGLLFLGFAVALYVVRDEVITLLFSVSFKGMSDLIELQLFGDLFRLLSYVIGFVCVAKAALRLYIIAELFQSGMFALFSWYSLHYGGSLSAVIHAYLITYILYFIVTLIGIYLYSRNQK
jgi:O-antigen/teichoic acid export membrane protein